MKTKKNNILLVIKEPNFRAEANRIMGCKNMPEDALRDEIMFSLMEIYQRGLEQQKRGKK